MDLLMYKEFIFVSWIAIGMFSILVANRVEGYVPSIHKLGQTLEKTNSFQYAWQSKKWQMHPEGYIYNGSGSKSNTYLASFMFAKGGI